MILVTVETTYTDMMAANGALLAGRGYTLKGRANDTGEAVEVTLVRKDA